MSGCSLCRVEANSSHLPSGLTGDIGVVSFIEKRVLLKTGFAKLLERAGASPFTSPKMLMTGGVVSACSALIVKERTVSGVCSAAAADSDQPSAPARPSERCDDSSASGAGDHRDKRTAAQAATSQFSDIVVFMPPFFHQGYRHDRTYV